MTEIQYNDTLHFLIYEVLGINTYNGKQIDTYQSIGRFLYNSAGNFLQKATKLVIAIVQFA